MRRRKSAPAVENPDFASAKAFVGVVEAKSFTAAALRLGLPKSAVSRRVSELEDELGVRLLHRTTRTLHLTEAGVGYYERLRRVLEAFADANDAARAMQGDPRGIIKITAPADFGARVLPDLLARFLSTYPHVRVELGLTGRRVDMVAEGFDIALRFGKLEDSSLVARKIDVGNLFVVGSPQYLARHGTPRRGTDLASHEVILFRPRDGANVWTLDGPHGPESITISGRLGADDLTFIREAVLRSLGLGFLPGFLIADDLKRKKLVRVLPKYSFPTGHFHLVYPSARLLPRRLSLLIDFLVAELPAAVRAAGD
jgi:DNA-binding transcriptional LysR family regulator